jgi:hypothetical protein
MKRAEQGEVPSGYQDGPEGTYHHLMMDRASNVEENNKRVHGTKSIIDRVGKRSTTFDSYGRAFDKGTWPITKSLGLAKSISV